jgi:predicted nucleic acid-binding protein
MIILDTNVVSEMMRLEPEPKVLSWLARNGRQEFCATSVSLAEILHGIAVLPHGRRRQILDASAQRVFAQAFARILPFDADAASHFAKVSASRKLQGLHLDIPDAMIAGIALSPRGEIATRNVRDFAGSGLVIRDPWTEL